MTRAVTRSIRTTRRNSIACALALLLASPALAQAPADEPPSAITILGRVKAAFRSRTKPPYVVYTLARRDHIDGRPDFENSYTLRIWCRTADRAALARRVVNNRGTDDLQFIRPEFDKPIDPGPPTADIFDALTVDRRSPPAPDGSLPPVIGSVAVLIESDYIATYAGIDGRDYHLKLEPKRDPERNRLADVYVDRASYALTRAVAHDRLYAQGLTIPELFEITFGNVGDVPVITAIHGRTDYRAATGAARSSAFHEVDYGFTDIRFPASLPAWYFEPAQYGAHFAEAPE